MTAECRWLLALLREGLAAERPDGAHCGAAGAVPADRKACIPDAAPDWPKIYALAARQGVLAVAWDGLRRLEAGGLIAAREAIDKKLSLQWAYNVYNIERRYLRQQNAAAALNDILGNEGARTAIFKGVSLALRYPIPEHRECGDIDIYPVGTDSADIERMLLRHGGRMIHRSTKHTELEFSGVTFEIHNYFLNGFLSRRNRAANEALDAMLRCAEPMPGYPNLLRPPARFDMLYIPKHAAGHFARDGITLRHVVDWAVLLRDDAGRTLPECEPNLFIRILNRIAAEYLSTDIADSWRQSPDDMCRRVLTDITAPAGTKDCGGNVLLRKIRRFTARRWTYPVIGESFFAASLRSLHSHMSDPETWLKN